MCNSIKDIVKLIAKRDGISENEAYTSVNYCIKELQDIMQNSGSYIQAEDCIADWLGLEMDYFDVLMYG